MEDELPRCNRIACRAEGANWWNTSTLAHYCEKCAKAINEGAGTDIHGVQLCVPPYRMPPDRDTNVSNKPDELAALRLLAAECRDSLQAALPYMEGSTYTAHYARDQVRRQIERCELALSSLPAVGS